MLALPSISIWTARRYDKKISDEVAEKEDVASDRLGRYNKCLINVKDARYKAIVDLASAARRWHEQHTLPWSQDGARILSVAMFAEYSDAMSEFRMKFEHAVLEFVRGYDDLKAQARQEMNGSYNEAQYPTRVEIVRKFAFGISIFPLPVANDFRVQELDPEQINRIKKSITSEVTDAVTAAERNKWEQLFKVIQHAVDRLSDEKAIFRDSLIENIKEACETLPKLSLSDDANFEAVVEEATKKLVVLDPQRLREDKGARADAKAKADAIAKKMRHFMS